jgi:hypothetical protein
MRRNGRLARGGARGHLPSRGGWRRPGPPRVSALLEHRSQSAACRALNASIQARTASSSPKSMPSAAISTAIDFARPCCDSSVPNSRLRRAASSRRPRRAGLRRSPPLRSRIVCSRTRDDEYRAAASFHWRPPRRCAVWRAGCVTDRLPVHAGRVSFARPRYQGTSDTKAESTRRLDHPIVVGHDRIEVGRELRRGRQVDRVERAERRWVEEGRR